MYRTPNGGGIVSTYIFHTGQAVDYEYDRADVVYVFDRSGLLVDVRQPGLKK